eukprot:jgi/Bigna1/88840/estExt_fgenesh1_pg.C_390037
MASSTSTMAVLYLACFLSVVYANSRGAVKVLQRKELYAPRRVIAPGIVGRRIGINRRTPFFGAPAERRNPTWKNAERPRRSITVRAGLDEKDPSPSPVASSSTPSWLPLFAIPALGGALFGYDIGATSAVVRLLGTGSSDLGSLDSLQLGLMASLPLLGAMLASGVIIGAGDAKIGRKTELYTASILYAVGTAIQSLSGSLDLILLGRIVYGLGIGVAMHAAPLYIAETTPSNLRGKLVSLKEAVIVLGIVAGYAAGALTNPSDPSAWRSIFEAALPVELAMFGLVSVLLTESPRWLALRGRKEEAVGALAKSQNMGREAAEIEVEEMIKFSNEGGGNTDMSFLERSEALLTDATNRKALTIGVGLVLLQQLSGQPSVLYYANRIFEKAGLGFEAAVGVGIFKTIMTLVSVALVEDPKWGRRPLLLTGTAGMTASLAALRVRSTALSIGTLSNFASNFLVSALFEFEREKVGEAALFAQFAVIALFALAFENAKVPETRGLSLEEIEAKLKED